MANLTGMAQDQNLPCLGCPHDSLCCWQGASLSEQEALDIAREHGSASVSRDADGALCTTLIDGVCVFLRDNRCQIHGRPYYPVSCHGFPWRDGATGELWRWDEWSSACPELPVATLVALITRFRRDGRLSQAEALLAKARARYPGAASLSTC